MRRVFAIPGGKRRRATLLLMALLLFAGRAVAMCDVIPNVAGEYRGALGTVNRPFAIPGDVGEMLTIELKNTGSEPIECDPMGLSFSANEADQNVTVLFVPPNGDANAVVVSTDCTDAGLVAAMTTCDGELAGTVTCDEASATDLVATAQSLTFRFPDTDARVLMPADDKTLTGPAKLVVTNGSDLGCSLASTRCANANVTGLLACVDELYQRNGRCDAVPRYIDPIFGHFTALPPANDYQALCTPDSNECTALQSEIRFTVDQAGNVLLPIDWRGILLRPKGVPVARLVEGSITLDAFLPGPIDAVNLPSRSFLASYSPGGIKLPPIFEPLKGTAAGPDDFALFGTIDAPIGVLRIARRMPDLSANTSVCLEGPNQGLRCSSDPECGGAFVCAPVSAGTPLYGECLGGPNLGLPCSGDPDCQPDGGAFVCGQTTCHDNQTQMPGPINCTDDTACGADHCGPVLFDFSDRLEDSGIGPVLATTFDLRAENPVPIEGLVESSELFAFVELEPIAAADLSPGNEGERIPANLNGDADMTDAVVVLRDRDSAEVQKIGPGMGMGQAVGRSVARVRRPPFSFSALAAEDDIVAFLEPEPLQGDCSTLSSCDQNADNDVFDSILRVFQLGTPTELTDPAVTLTARRDVEAEPLVDGRSLVVSNGIVYYRRDEAGGATQENEIMSLLAGGGEQTIADLRSGFISADGRYVGFSGSDEFVSPNMGRIDAYLRDRDTLDDGVFDQADVETRRISIRSNGAVSAVPPNESSAAAISEDGRYVAFVSEARDLALPFEVSIDNDVHVHDRDLDGNGTFDLTGMGDTVDTSRVSITNAGAEADDASGEQSFPRMSSDGRYVVFDSVATDLVTGDANALSDVFVRDRTGAETVRVSITSGDHATALELDGASTDPALSADGRYVVFVSDAPLLGASFDTLFIHDRDADGDGDFDVDMLDLSQEVTTTEIAVSSLGEVANGFVQGQPSISADGRFVAFRSVATNLVAGDTNDVSDVFLHDRDADEDGVFDEAGGISTVRVSVGSGGEQANGTINLANDPFVSPDGRYVAFGSPSADLVPPITTPCLSTDCVHVYVHDRLLRLTQIATVDTATDPVTNAKATLRGLSELGRYVLFTGASSDLSPAATSDRQTYVRGPDLSSAADIVLERFDPNAGAPYLSLGAALQASVHAGDAAFVRPDGSVYLSVQGAMATDTSLGQVASEVALSATLLAAFVPSGGGPDEGLLYVCDPGNCAATWAQVGTTADAFRLDGDLLVFRAVSDGTLYVYDANAGLPVTPIGGAPMMPAVFPAVDFVVSAGANAGEGVVAFRTSENAVGAVLNNDGDPDDAVLRVYDVLTDTVYETEQAATPCRLEACDPRAPYRINGRTVSFLTLEAEQDEDLNGDGLKTSLFLQHFHLDEAIEIGQVLAGECTDPLAGLGAGVCAVSGDACLTDTDCLSGTCFLPPGSCAKKTATPCDIGDDLDCTGTEFCAEVPDMPATFRCFDRAPMPDCPDPDSCLCQDDAECEALTGVGAGFGFCFDGLDDQVRLFDPLPEMPSGAQALVTAGLVQDAPGTACVLNTDCVGTDVCSEGRCQSSDPHLKIVGASDTDGDGILDHLDNCALQPNADQADDDMDGVGNVCLPEPRTRWMLGAGILLILRLARRSRRPTGVASIR